MRCALVTPTFALAWACVLAPPVAAQALSSIDAQARRVLAETHANGLTVAVVQDGRVVDVAALGVRNANGDTLDTNTIMYGASLTKAVFTYLVVRLVDAGKVDLDKPLASYLDR